MNCSQARRMLSACLDRDLSFAEDEELRRHLRGCEACGGEMECLERVQALLRDLPETQPEPGFYEAVCRRIEHEGAQTRPSGVRTRFGLGGLLEGAWAVSWLRPVAGVALGLAIGLLIGTGGGPTPQPAGEIAAVSVPATGSTPSVSDPTLGTPQALLVGAPPAEAITGGPLADLDLARADSILLEEEYVREPYVTDPQGRLVRPHLVSGDQNVLITF